MGENTPAIERARRQPSYLWIAIAVLLVIQLALFVYFFGGKYFKPTPSQNMLQQEKSVTTNTPIVSAPDGLKDFLSRQFHDEILISNGITLTFTTAYLVPAKELPKEAIPSGMQALVLLYDLTNITATQAAATVPLDDLAITITDIKGIQQNENTLATTFQTGITRTVAGDKKLSSSLTFYIPDTYKDTQGLLLMLSATSLTPQKLFIAL